MNQRKKEVVAICLDTFVKKGLSETTVRDLSSALNLQSGGIYWWFKDKNEAVVTCAEEAALILEDKLIVPTFLSLNTPDKMMDELFARADEMRDIMRFFTSVCMLQKYEEQMRPVLLRLTERYEFYTTKFAERLKCSTEEITPYFCIAVTAVTNYMMFNEKGYIIPQIELIKSALLKFIENAGGGTR